MNPLLTTLDFPDNWLPIKLSQILRVSSGKSLKRTQLTEDGNVPVYGAHGIMGSYSEGFIEKGTLLIGRVGFYAGSIMRTKEFSWVTDNSLIVSSSSVVNSNFLELSLKHLNLGSLTSQTAQPVISGQKIYSQIIFLPPVNEQTKIVDSYNELISKVNTIEKEQEQLKQLATQLKQKVLDVAMQGKLVPQDPNDEPASVLLEKIRAEKQRLYEEGKIKKKDLVETEIVKDGDNAYYQKLP
ncbi:restriction endonuclease subunit S, partial [Ligilactobacillus murinus]|nr:restriction endonuclease subunit S [Ligilactobacillus murinus]